MILSYKIKFFNFYEEWFCNKLNKEFMFKLYVCHDSRKDYNNLFFIKKKKYTLITNLKQETDLLMRSFTSNLRNEIRKIDKIDNLTILYNEIDINTFLEFYNTKFATPKGLSLLQKRQVEKFKDNIFFISASLDNELTNIQVYIFDETQKIVRLLHSISIIHLIDDKKKRNQIGWINKALHYKVMLYFKEKGYEIFDWGGYSNDPSNKALAGIDKMKKSFGGEMIEVYDYYSIPFFLLSKLKEFLK